MKKYVFLLLTLIPLSLLGQIEINSPSLIVGLNAGFGEFQKKEMASDHLISFGFEGGLRYSIKNKRKNYGFKYDIFSFYEYSADNILHLNSIGVKSQFHLAETSYKEFHISMILGIHGSYVKVNEYFENQNFYFNGGSIGADFNFCLLEQSNLIFGFKYNHYFLSTSPEESIFYEQDDFGILIFNVGFLLNTNKRRY